MNKKDFLIEKIANFKKFVTNKVPNVPKFKNTLLKLTECSIEEFYIFMQNFLLKYKNRVDDCIKDMCKQYDVKLSDFETEDINKFKLYLECFIELCE